MCVQNAVNESQARCVCPSIDATPMASRRRLFEGLLLIQRPFVSLGFTGASGCTLAEHTVNKSESATLVVPSRLERHTSTSGATSKNTHAKRQEFAPGAARRGGSPERDISGIVRRSIELSARLASDAAPLKFRRICEREHGTNTNNVVRSAP